MISSLDAARVSRRSLQVAVPTLLLFLTGCASTPPVPTASLQSAEKAILVAESAGAITHATAELDDARGKLADAQRAVGEEEMIAARRLADEARVDADLAAARTNAAKARAVNDDMERSTEVLIEEMQRKTGDTR